MKLFSNLMRANKRGFAQLVPLIISIGTAIVLLGVMASLVSQTRDTFTADTAEYNITSLGLTALLTLSGYWGIIVTIGIFVIILGALMTMFRGGARR